MISFIIPAYNEELRFGRTLDALHNAAGGLEQPYEIVRMMPPRIAPPSLRESMLRGSCT